MIAEIELNYDITIFLEKEEELTRILSGNKLEDKIVDRINFRLGKLTLEINVDKVFQMESVAGIAVDNLWEKKFEALVYIDDDVCDSLRKNNQYGGRYTDGLDGSKVSIKLVDSLVEISHIDFLREVINRWDEYVKINMNRHY